MKKMTKKQINKKYFDKYVDIYERPSWDTDKNNDTLYEIRKVFSVIHEDTTLGQDVGTSLAYRR